MKQFVLFSIGTVVSLAMCLQGTVMFPDHPALVGISSAVVVIAFIEGVEHHFVRWLLDKLGFKPHLRSCPNNEHWWRAVYGDERNVVGARYICENCPQKINELSEDALVVESESERMIREYRRRLR